MKSNYPLKGVDNRSDVASCVIHGMIMSCGGRLGQSECENQIVNEFVGALILDGGWCRCKEMLVEGKHAETVGTSSSQQRWLLRTGLHAFSGLSASSGAGRRTLLCSCLGFLQNLHQTSRFLA
jgi:hypothetical protein